MITKEENEKIEYCRKMIIDEIQKMVINTEFFKQHLTPEVKISVIHLEIFSSYLKPKKFDTIEESWRFMEDLNGIIEKVFYVNNFLLHIKKELEKKELENKKS